MRKNLFLALTLIAATLCVGALAGGARAQMAPATATQTSPRDPASLGRALFLRCAACHATTAHGVQKIGPHLQEIVGRNAGSIEGFSYSAAMQESQIIWDSEHLDRFLARPANLVPGTSMAFGGIDDPQQRAALIAYLASLK